MKKRPTKNTIPTETIQDRILLIRGQKVILDSDLAALYKVPTKRLNEQVKRNRKRFPSDFMFQLTPDEKAEVVANYGYRNRSQFVTASNLRSQNATSSGHGGRRYLPYAFTEHGALMAANILNSERAVVMSIYVIRAFVRLREALALGHIWEGRLAEIEKVLLNHDAALEELFQKIRLLLLPPKKVDAIGFEASPSRPGKIG